MLSTFKPSKQCEAAVRKANRALYQLGRAVKSRKPAVIVPLYKTFVRPHVEFCVQAWGPYFKKDISLLSVRSEGSQGGSGIFGTYHTKKG